MTDAWGGDALVSLLTLTVMEIVLGIDNVVFIAIITGRLPAAQQPLARHLGIGLALVIRIGLLFAISWIMGLTRPFMQVLGHPVSGRDLILLGGGFFLIDKATWEIYDKLEADHAAAGQRGGGRGRFLAVLVQILILDIVFSLDSVITAVGMARHLAVMIIAVVLAVGFMLVFAGNISGFIEKHPTLKILALSFLMMIGGTLVMEGFGQEVHKGYIYFAMAFSSVVEILNIRLRKKAATKVELHQPYR